MSYAILASHLSFFYERNPILKKIDFSVPTGQFLGIIGPNGGGKTTLLKLIMGFLTPSSGTIHLFGKSPIEMRKRIGYVPQVNQSDRAFPITVLELVMLGAIANQFSVPAGTKEKALDWLEKLGLAPHRSKAFSSLSGGLAQRTLLARALMSDPDLLLLDESTANIDAHSKKTFFETLESFRGKKTILLVTHDLKAITEHVDQILCVENQLTTYHPSQVCEHFALGLYHPPIEPQHVIR